MSVCECIFGAKTEYVRGGLDWYVKSQVKKKYCVTLHISEYLNLMTQYGDYFFFPETSLNGMYVFFCINK
jgi:hypothetical protein